MASPSYLGPPVAGSGIASAKVGGSGTANLPPDVAARFKQMRDRAAQIGIKSGNSRTGPGMIGPPQIMPPQPGPGLIGPPETPGPGLIGPPESTGSGPALIGPPVATNPYSDVMRILMGGSEPNFYGQSLPSYKYSFPQFSNLLMNWGGR